MIGSKNIILLDTNILVYAADDTSSFQKTCVKIRTKVLNGEIPACISPQILNEFYVIITNPTLMRNPFKPTEAIEEIEKYVQSKNIMKIYPAEGTMEKMISLFKIKPVKMRKGIFDLHLAATMLVNEITHLCTYNTKDFKHLKNIILVKPEDLSKT